MAQDEGSRLIIGVRKEATKPEAVLKPVCSKVIVGTVCDHEPRGFDDLLMTSEGMMGKTLVVDDFSTMRKIVKNVLRQIDITDVAEAENGKMALDILRKDAADFELIVSDWVMPEMSGIDFLKACKEDETIRTIPFLMLTAEAQKDSVLEAIREGVDNYIIKPFTPDKLHDAVQKAKAKYGC